MKPYLPPLLLILTGSCKSQEKLKNELCKAELAFSASSAQKGFYAAMLDVAAQEIALFDTGDTVINGLPHIHKNIQKFAESPTPPYTLTWKPEKVDVARSGDLGYTYGWYTLSQKDSLGNVKSKKGLYSSIWKKIHGEWKLVLD
jgi:ketosteroid isomerase-like protein